MQDVQGSLFAPPPYCLAHTFWEEKYGEKKWGFIFFHRFWTFGDINWEGGGTTMTTCGNALGEFKPCFPKVL